MAKRRKKPGKRHCVSTRPESRTITIILPLPPVREMRAHISKRLTLLSNVFEEHVDVVGKDEGREACSAFVRRLGRFMKHEICEVAARSFDKLQQDAEKSGKKKRSQRAARNFHRIMSKLS